MNAIPLCVYEAQSSPCALARYHDRIVEVLGQARGQRVMIRSIHADGVERRTAMTWINLLSLDGQLF